MEDVKGKLILDCMSMTPPTGSIETFTKAIGRGRHGFDGPDAFHGHIEGITGPGSSHDFCHRQLMKLLKQVQAFHDGDSLRHHMSRRVKVWRWFWIIANSCHSYSWLKQSSNSAGLPSVEACESAPQGAMSGLWVHPCVKSGIILKRE
jgi:hypothetical protein